MALDPINALADALEALWLSRGFTAPLLYGYREARRTATLDALPEHGGRVVWHAGAWPGRDAAAGELEADPRQAQEMGLSGRNIFTHWQLFTIHCNGYDPAFPDATAPGAERAHDGMTWRLMQTFLGVWHETVVSNSANGWESRNGPPVWVRDPAERRFGELLRFEIICGAAVRQWPAYQKQEPTPVPTVKVTTPNGTATIIGGP